MGLVFRFALHKDRFAPPRNRRRHKPIEAPNPFVLFFGLRPSLVGGF